jgi:hypothetical protein
MAENIVFLLVLLFPREGDLNVGAVIILPDGFQLAPPNRIPSEIKERVGMDFDDTDSDEGEDEVEAVKSIKSVKKKVKEEITQE